MITITEDSFPLAQTFTISRGSKTEARVLTVCITRDGITGRGECVPYARYGETLESVRAQIEALPHDIGLAALPELMPPVRPEMRLTAPCWILGPRRREGGCGTSWPCGRRGRS